jgi:hypothetical protein
MELLSISRNANQAWQSTCITVSPYRHFQFPILSLIHRPYFPVKTNSSPSTLIQSTPVMSCLIILLHFHHNTYHYLKLYNWFVYHLSPVSQNVTLIKAKVFTFLILDFQDLEQCLSHTKYSINIYEINKWIISHKHLNFIASVPWHLSFLHVEYLYSLPIKYLQCLTEISQHIGLWWSCHYKA